MGSYGGHVLPGTFFLMFGFWYAIRYAVAYLRPKSKNAVFYCCNGKIPFSTIVIEGVVKIVMICIGILVELYYPGAPMGKLHDDNGNFTGPMNWQHATMYFFFGLSGAFDIVSYMARDIIPPGMDRLFGGVALFIEGYLFYFHLHGRSMIDTRVHILLVLMVWTSSVIALLETFFINQRKTLHVLEMLRSVTIIAQGIWFWQVAYILYPPHGKPWDPCAPENMNVHEMHKRHGGDEHEMTMSAATKDCNEEGHTTLNFITLFWSWHLALAICLVSLLYFIVYKLLKASGGLDKRFSHGYQSLLPHSSAGTNRRSSNNDNQSLINADDLEDDIL